MRWPQPIIVLLILAIALLDVCAWLAADGKVWPDAVVMFRMALAISQTSLLAMWAALGHGKWWLRIPIALAAVALLSWTIKPPNSDPENGSAVLFSLEMQAVMIIALLSISRFLGREFKSAQNSSDAGSDAKPRGQWQFSIADVLLFIAAWAMLLAIGIETPMPSNLYGPIADFLSAAIFAPPAAVLVIAVFYEISLLMRIILLVAISAESLWLARYIDTGAQSAVFVSFFLAVTIITCGSMLCVRAAGYRLVRVKACD
jgi:hypothetical protein